MTDRRTRRLLFVLGAIAVLAVLFWFKGRPAMADFEVNYKAGGRLLAGETLYRTEDLHWQFKYSPFAAILYLPLSFLPLAAAKMVWFFVVAAAIVLVVRLATRILSAAGRPPAAPAVLLAAAVMARFFLRELQLGQINAIITVLLLAAAVELQKGQGPAPEARAGIFWGLATALKPYAVIFLPYLLVRRKIRPLAAGLAVVGVSLLVPAAFYGFPGLGAVLREWTGTLSRSTPGLFDTQDNVSLMGLFVKWTADIRLSAILLAAAAVLLALLTLFAVLRGKFAGDPLPLDAGLLLLFIPLLSPLGWDYTFLSAFPAVLTVFRHWDRFPAAWRAVLAVNAAVTGLAVYDLLGRRLYAAFMAASIPTLNFLIFAAALFYLRTKRAA